jgi:2-keto-4-pentenoate hydratase/2-oxohepta-3-ene-1,7-dioic acid hydratase in catechol pathway
MKLCTYEVVTPVGRLRRTGIVTDAGIVDACAVRTAFLERSLPARAAARIGAAQAPIDMIALIGSGPLAVEWLGEALQVVLPSGTEQTSDGQRILHARDAVRLLAPVPRPAGIANFSVWPAHSADAASRGVTLAPATAGAQVKTYWKGNPDSVVGPDTVLEVPPYADTIDVECEFGIVVGMGGRDLDRAGAQRAIAGYTILNDVSARDVQLIEMKSGRGPSKGKDFDTGNVMGPWIVTPDEITDPKSLTMSLVVNGQELSRCGTDGMVWEFAEMLSYMSTSQTIYPGQVLSAGCYAGGSAREMKCILKPGDLVELRITGIGVLRNTIGGKRAA